MPSVSAFWWRGAPNFGDRLTPLLLSRFAHIDAVWAPPEKADVVCVGSILGTLVGPTFEGAILGSGKLFEDGVVPANARILALRGPLTAKGVRGDYAIGDPGLLADELVKVETKLYDLGIIAHWKDRTLALDPRFAERNPVIIDARADPIDVLQTIGTCRHLISSSLHGLIVADAFGIPRQFEATADWTREGGLFKVRDYCASVGVPFEIGVMQQPKWGRIIELKSDLWYAFRTLGGSQWTL